ncbi:MAG: lipopolysaccharide heptosyltransferase I [Casimicrobiaceae bacterium]
MIKTSSLGDVVHALPAISDIAHTDRWEIDWVCEDAFADIPALHPAVGRVIPCAIRRWRRTWSTAPGRAEIAAFIRALQSTRYDVVLDLQGLIKSALVVRLARGDRHGYAWHSAREPLASLAYDYRHIVAWGQHAIFRNRQLTSAALATSISGPPRFGLKIATRADIADPCVVALHATSRADKLWPEDHWRRVLAGLSGDGVRVVLPWGNNYERARSLRLAYDIAGASVPERMSPGALAELFARAVAVVGVDTGLLHLATAVGTPSAAIFVSTDPALTGVIGERAPAVNLGGNGSTPDVGTVLRTIAPWLTPATSGPQAGR